MTAWVWDPADVMERFVSQLLKGSAAVTAELPNGADSIWPDVDPTDDPGRQLLHGFAGGAVSAKPIGQPISMVSVLWDVTAWEPRFSRQAVGPLIRAVMTAMIGSETRGQQVQWDDADGRLYVFTLDIASPTGFPVVALDATRALVWAPRRHRYAVSIEPQYG